MKRLAEFLQTGVEMVRLGSKSNRICDSSVCYQDYEYLNSYVELFNFSNGINYNGYLLELLICFRVGVN